MRLPIPTTGQPAPLGVTVTATGANIAVLSRNATAVEFCLFTDDGSEYRIPLPARTGDVFHGEIPGIVPGHRYGLRVHGRWAPAEGHRFNPTKLLIDPYAMALDSIAQFHPSQRSSTDSGAMDDTNSAHFVPKAIVCQPESGPIPVPLVPWDKTVIYEAHVRGYSMRHPDITSRMRGTFAGLAHPASIAHLKALGITTLEIMPPCAWISERHLTARGLENYWGYNTIAFMTPDPRLAPGGWPEVRAAVWALARAGIETIVDLVLNHTGEGDETGPTLSLRGIDNALYFRAGSTNPWRDANDSGCGNTLALHRTGGLRLAMDTLRAWAKFGGVHGFRFDLATILGRREDGYDQDAPLLTAIDADPELSKLKIIAEPWDCGPGGWRTGQFPGNWGEWNDRFRDDVRRFWRGDQNMLGPLATRLAGSSDLFGRKYRPSRTVNFITAHDGFTLADLTAYTAKHNEANGEDNRDGTDANNSWNHSVEGPTADPAIIAAREADQRALIAITLLSRGTPMLAMGSEFGQSQHGNNNPYAQDNETAWLDWANGNRPMLAWTRQMIALRRDLPALHDDAFLTGVPAPGEPNPDVVWLRPDGRPLEAWDWNRPDAATLIMVICRAAQRVALCINRGQQNSELTLPPAEEGKIWKRAADSAYGSPQFQLTARSVQIWAEQPDPVPIRREADPALLGRLAQAAGISEEWWETDGTHHHVTPDTQRHMLGALGIDAGSNGEIRDALASLAESGPLRPIPESAVVRLGSNMQIRLGLPAGRAPVTTWLIAEGEDGSSHRIRAGSTDARVLPCIAPDRRGAQIWKVTLPDLAIGRYQIWREDAPWSKCHLTVAPGRCYLPPALRDGGRRFGLSAQLYSLRRSGDQGIGDFTTLAHLLKGTRAAGGAALALNPMHALFPDERERASPYQPSDRRFLDPIYLDVPQAAPATESLRWSNQVEYVRVWAAKMPWLWQRFLNEMHSEDFARFRTERGQSLADFALFQAIAETRIGVPWPQWAGALSNPRSEDCAAFAASHAQRILFHSYQQYLSDKALAEASRGLEIGIIRDLAVGCAPDGAEAWALGDRMVHGVSVGAPPDPFSAEGQVWGLPPMNPLAMRRTGYADFAELLATNLRHAGGLRIDHALGLARLFYVPEGGKASDGTYVAYPFSDLLGQVALESHNAKALIIGEDLGTVLDGLREALTANDILGYRVLLLERDGMEFRARDSYPQRAVTCVSTHDLPTLRGWQEAADITERTALGLSAPPVEEREADIAALRQVVGEGDLAEAAHRFVAETGCDLAYVQAEDIAGEREAVNLPGTDRERPNWRRRVTVPVEELFSTPDAGILIGAISTGRLPGGDAA